MLSAGQGEHRDREMRVVGSTNDNGVYLARHFVEHLAEVLVFLRIGIFVHNPLGVFFSHCDVANRNDIYHIGSGEFFFHLVSAVSYTHQCYIDLSVSADYTFLTFLLAECGKRSPQA